MDVRLSFRDLDAADLSDLDWSGGPEHIRAVAVALEASYAGEVGLLVGFLPNDRLIAQIGRFKITETQPHIHGPQLCH